MHPRQSTIDIFIYAAFHSWSCVFILCVCASFMMVRLYVNCGRLLFLFLDGIYTCFGVLVGGVLNTLSQSGLGSDFWLTSASLLPSNVRQGVIFAQCKGVTF